MSIITLMTDYGTSDQYVAALKGVIYSIAREARIVDISHDIAPHNVRHGAFVLRHALPWFPEETIHVAVVDPGVGSERRILLARYEGQYVIAPDNGLLSFLQRELRVEALHVVENRRLFLPQVGTTFHGRDIMAPVAAQLANGVKPRDIGRSTSHLEMLPIVLPPVAPGVIGGIAIHADRFGNLITSINRQALAGLRFRDRPASVYVNGENIGQIQHTFSSVKAGEVVACVGGSELLEIAVNQGRAVDRFGPVDQVFVEVK